MDSSDIRWLIAGLFVAFLLIVVLSDRNRRKTKARANRKTDEGFRQAGHAPSPKSARPQTSWKTPRR